MIRELIERYYYFYWLILGLVIFIKLILSTPLHAGIHGTVGFFIVVFKWYNSIEIAIADTPKKKLQMRIQNILTLAIYFWIIIIAGVSLLKILF